MDLWVPNYQGLKPHPRGMSREGAICVKDLISWLGHRDVLKVRDRFDLVDAITILAAPLLIQPRFDKWIWLPCKSRKFSSQSAYLTSQNQCFSIASSIPR